MILPKGKARHQDLMTSYTDVSALISTLKSEGFSGTVEIEFPERKGALFIDSGEIINGEAETGAGSKRMIGPEAIQYLLTLSKQKDGVVNLYQLLPEQVAVVASSLHHQILFKELSTDFTRFDRLILKLKEEKHNGFIEVLTKDHQPLGVLFIQEGEPIEMFTTPTSGPSVFGRKLIPPFVENAAKEGATFNVYRTLNKPLAHGETGQEGSTAKVVDGEEVILIFQEILSRVENSVDSIFQQKGKFLLAFKKSLLEKADKYSFLDPFGNEFEYRKGKVRFTGDVEDKELVRGISECLRATLAQLSRELPKQKALFLRLKDEIESSLKPHPEIVKQLEIDTSLSPFLQ